MYFSRIFLYNLLVKKVMISLREKAQGLVEYALIMVMIVLVVILVLKLFGVTLTDYYQGAVSTLESI
jgi:Flp pilus assembly pilin Flp